MKTLSIPLLRKSFKKLGYKYSENLPNIIGIRSSLSVADVFNDILVLTFKQPKMPEGLSTEDQQRFLNRFGFKGKNNKALLEDGDKGPQTLHALESYLACAGKERSLHWSITTDPGSYYLQHPLSKLGAAVLVPGQYSNTYQMGLHQGKADHPALVQTGGKVKVYRDNDKDVIAETGQIEDGFFGINIHRASKTGTTEKIGKWSAGCQVFQKKADHTLFLDILDYFKKTSGNRYTYTLIREDQLS